MARYADPTAREKDPLNHAVLSPLTLCRFHEIVQPAITILGHFPRTIPSPGVGHFPPYF